MLQRDIGRRLEALEARVPPPPQPEPDLAPLTLDEVIEGAWAPLRAHTIVFDTPRRLRFRKGVLERHIDQYGELLDDLNEQLANDLEGRPLLLMSGRELREALAALDAGLLTWWVRETIWLNDGEDRRPHRIYGQWPEASVIGDKVSKALEALEIQGAPVPASLDELRPWLLDALAEWEMLAEQWEEL